jgi:serine/alanine adding enzyme
MPTEIRELRTLEDFNKWDSYVLSHPRATLYHLSGWQRVFEKTYGHKSYYLVAEEAVKEDSCQAPGAGREAPASGGPCLNQVEKGSPNSGRKQAGGVVGVLPLVHMKSFIFGNALVSVPFFDFGGVLSENDKVAAELLARALELRRSLRADLLELRHAGLVPWPEQEGRARRDFEEILQSLDVFHEARTHKVRMLLDLPGSSKDLLDSFKSKLRSQIKKALKEGLETRIGGEELLVDFYKVFSENMRDLGSPVHSIGMMKNVVAEFADTAKVIMVYRGHEPVACGMMIGFSNVMEHPWASSLKKYSRLSPNMLLYWAMLEYACDNGFKQFDFGRSSPDEGTYKFKEQWGAKPSALNWYYVGNHDPGRTKARVEKDRFQKVITCWQRLPVGLTRLLGPKIRKHISL